MRLGPELIVTAPVLLSPLGLGIGISPCLQTSTAVAAPPTSFFLLEDGSGYLLLEDGTSKLGLE